MYTSGIHQFSDATPPYPEIEIVIQHKSSNNTYLYVCIPVFGTSSNTSSNLVDQLINEYTSDAASLYLQSFNLKYIIPKSTYFVHNGKYRSNDTDRDVYITFPSTSFYLNSTTITKFHKLCKSSYDLGSTFPVTVYQNEKGTTENGFSGEGQIYIDCQPTDSEGEIIFKETGKSPLPPIDVRTLLVVLFSILFFIFSLYLLRFIKSKFLDYSPKDLVRKPA
jgi:hypothetical protein